jgi:hypothetical protein
MKTQIYVIATSNVLLSAWATLNKKLRVGLTLEEVVNFALKSNDMSDDELEMAIFDVVYFRHQKDKEFQSLFSDESTEGWRITYDVLMGRICKLVSFLKTLNVALQSEIKKHVDFNELPGKKALFGVDPSGDVLILVRDLKDDEGD